MRYIKIMIDKTPMIIDENTPEIEMTKEEVIEILKQDKCYSWYYRFINEDVPAAYHAKDFFIYWI